MINDMNCAPGAVAIEPVAWLTYDAYTGKPFLTFEQFSELASTPLYAAPPVDSGKKLASWEVTSIANELWQMADQVGYEQFKDAVTELLKTGL